jgi:hypothetical protein
MGINWNIWEYTGIYSNIWEYILSTTPQLSISQKALGTLPEDGNVTPNM